MRMLFLGLAVGGVVGGKRKKVMRPLARGYIFGGQSHAGLGGGDAGDVPRRDGRGALRARAVLAAGGRRRAGRGRAGSAARVRWGDGAGIPRPRALAIGGAVGAKGKKIAKPLARACWKMWRCRVGGLRRRAGSWGAELREEFRDALEEARPGKRRSRPQERMAEEEQQAAAVALAAPAPPRSARRRAPLRPPRRAVGAGHGQPGRSGRARSARTTPRAPAPPAPALARRVSRSPRASRRAPAGGGDRPAAAESGVEGQRGVQASGGQRDGRRPGPRRPEGSRRKSPAKEASVGGGPLRPRPRKEGAGGPARGGAEVGRRGSPRRNRNGCSSLEVLWMEVAVHYRVGNRWRGGNQAGAS